MENYLLLETIMDRNKLFNDLLEKFKGIFTDAEIKHMFEQLVARYSKA